jgi:hypothetical protein
MNYTNLRCPGPLCINRDRYDHQDRLTAKEAQSHPYFAPVREAEAREGMVPSPASLTATGIP